MCNNWKQKKRSLCFQMAMANRIIMYNLLITWPTNYVRLLDNEFETPLKAQSTKESL